MQKDVTGWCGNEFESHSYPFLLIYLEVEFKLMTFRLDSVFNYWKNNQIKDFYSPKSIFQKVELHG